MAELPRLGKHCDVSSCKQLDFLPFQCDGCGGTFCTDHRSKADHQCTEHLVSVASGTYDGVKSYPCGFPGCERRELSLVICDKCDTNYCLGHRHQQDHCCSALKGEPVRNAKTADHVQKLLESKDPVKKKARGAKSAQTSAMVTLMKIKMKADGPKGLPDAEKVFFNVVLPELVGQKEKPLFFSNKWSIGRVIDFIATTAGIHNPNNTTAEKKLRLFSGISGELLPTDAILSEVLEKQADLFSGSTVWMEYVTADCQHLNINT